MMMARIELQQLTKEFDGNAVVRSVTIKVEDGEFFTLLGPSGCGKTTLLRMVAGLEGATSGRVFFDELDVTERAPKDRDIALVFQDYALYPHLSVRENLAFPLRARKIPSAQRDKTISDVAQRLHLETLLERRPRQLSGGQQQRVALGRAMVRSPKVFLMDEPLSNLDAKLRVEMRAELKRLQRDVGITTVYVTHDQEEALSLSDRIAVMRDGTVQQCASPTLVYRLPANLWVASFVGSPAMNLFNLDVLPNGHLRSVSDQPCSLQMSRQVRPGPVTLGIRPEDVLLGDVASGQGVPGRVELVELVGDHVLVLLETPLGRASAKASSENPPRSGDRVSVAFVEAKIHLFDFASGERL